jgi:hypothetical protein
MTAELDLAGLKAMLAEATPGDWAWRIEPQRYPECDDVDLPATVSGGGAHIAWLNERYDTNINQMNDKDAALIVAAKNKLPALIQRIEELEEAAREADEALDANERLLGAILKAIDTGRNEPLFIVRDYIVKRIREGALTPTKGR